MDGSFHDWLEERGPGGCMMNMTDDATSAVELRLGEEETIWAAANYVLPIHVQACGTPCFSIHDRNRVGRRPDRLSSSPSRNSTATVASSVIFIMQPPGLAASNQSVKNSVICTNSPKCRRLFAADDTVSLASPAPHPWPASIAATSPRRSSSRPPLAQMFRRQRWPKPPLLAFPVLLPHQLQHRDEISPAGSRTRSPALRCLNPLAPCSRYRFHNRFACR